MMETNQSDTSENRVQSVGVSPVFIGSQPHPANYILEIHLKRDARRRLQQSINQQTRGVVFMNDRDAAEMCEIGKNALAANLSDNDLTIFRQFGTGGGKPIIKITGLPHVKPIPDTPYTGVGDETATQFSDCIQLGVLRLLGGAPVAFEFENNKHLFRNVVPSPNASWSTSSHGSLKPLSFHTDNPCGPFDRQKDGRSPIPRFLTFSGFRSEDGKGIPVSTDILPTEPVLNRLRDWAVEALESSEYQVNPPESNNCPPLHNVALVERDNHGRALIRFNARDGQIRPLSLRAANAVKQLAEAIEESESEIIPVNVAYGTILIFDNYRVLHRRSSFDPGLDLTKSRWLRRCFGTRDINAGIFVDRPHWPFLWK